MNTLWNRKDLERPANNVWIATRKEIDLKKFCSTLNLAIKDLESQNILHTEASILSRLIYRMKSKFRSDKGLKNMEKVNRALLNYLEIQLQKEYKYLKKCVEPDGCLVNLPTKQMLQFVLVRTQGFAKLICRIECVSKSAAQFFKARISIGHAWTVSVIAYAVVSRIWYLSRYLLKRCCLWYDNVFQYLNEFRLIGATWLPENYHLPESLKTWLDLPWIDEPMDSVPLKDDGKETIFSLIKSQIDDPPDLNIDNENIDEYFLKKVDDSVEDIRQSVDESNDKKPEVVVLSDDIGITVDREIFEINLAEKVTDSVELVKSEKNVGRKKKKITTKTRRITKSDEEIVPVKRRKKEKETILQTNESKSLEIKQILGKANDCNPPKIKSREDLLRFMSENSHPKLDKLQWKMLTKSIRKFVTKLEKCEPSEDKRQKFLLKKVNVLIKNYLQ